MRISDWSSDVCSSDLLEIVRVLGDANGGGTLRSATATEERNLLWKARHHLLWASRSMVPEAQAWITDICVPISRLAEAISRAETMIEASGLFAPILGRSEEHTSELQSLMRISYAVFCLKQKHNI